ncbi:hypothetical protein LCGC14_1809100 [marine sediment metagenome]|uniref:Uncharacterized protein n=1 Tax=marine sediment metagenome TaxID=412755 RepID=A0A0F9J234_9ZZZZ
MEFHNPKIWFTHNGTFLNMTVIGYHVHVWMWGLRVRKAKPKHFHYIRVWRVCNVTFFPEPNTIS